MLCISYDLVSYIWFISCNEFQTKNNLPKFLEHFADQILKRYFLCFFFTTNFNASCLSGKLKRSTKVNVALKINQPKMSQKDTTNIVESCDSLAQQTEKQTQLTSKLIANSTVTSSDPQNLNNESKMETPPLITIFRDNSNTSFTNLPSDLPLTQQTTVTNKIVKTANNSNFTRLNSKHEIIKEVTNREIINKDTLSLRVESKKMPQSEVILQQLTPSDKLVQPSPQKCNFCDMCEKCLKTKTTEQDTKNKKKILDENIRALNYFAAFLLCMTMIACDLIIWLLISYPPRSYSE